MAPRAMNTRPHVLGRARAETSFVQLIQSKAIENKGTR